jgi:hypothetical protein
VSRLTRAGVGVDVPPGWEGDISGGDRRLLGDGAREPTIVHLASFPIPPKRGSFGAGAVEHMNPRDIFITLFEYGPESAGTALFSNQGIPRQVLARDFDRDALQIGVAGQSGLQRFFTHRGRAFCLYVVLGSHIDRADLADEVNAVLATIDIQ